MSSEQQPTAGTVAEPDAGHSAETLGTSEADAVFEGGGVKGIALVGALQAFAERGCAKWVNVAGTSAGAIIAAYLACGHTPDDAEDLLRHTPYPSFEDWGPGGKYIGGLINLARHHGLAHGQVFRDWFDEAVERKTFAAIPKRKDGTSCLRLIAADVTRREMLVLPDDLFHYRVPTASGPIDAEEFRIADAVRMSMSIPYFFQPVELIHDETNLPSTIVDGGVLSNFPVWLFDVDRDPLRPTFGFRLTGGRGVGGGLQRIVNGLGWPVELGTSIFHTACEAWDARFMTHSTAVRTCPISAGDVGTTDFTLDPQTQDWLISSGRQGADAFLDDFRIEQYVNTYGHGFATGR